MANGILKIDRITVEDLEQYTVLRLIHKLIGTTNELVDSSSDIYEKLDYLLKDGLSEEVAETLTQWLNDGTLSDIITEDVLVEINNRLTKLEQVMYVKPEWLDTWNDSLTDHTLVLKQAIQLAETLKVPVLLSSKEYVITSPLEITRNVAIQGNGSSSIIKADYSRWKGSDYRSIIIRGGIAVFKSIDGWNRIFKDFIVRGVGNENIASTAIFIGTNDTIDVNTAVNNSLISSRIENVYVENYDTGLYIQEMWNSVVDNFKCCYCRVGINIKGKSVNNVFQNCALTNFSTDHTSTKYKTFGILTDSGFHYANGTEGRPEGFMFDNILIFGANCNINITRALQFTLSDSIIDGAIEDCVYLVAPDFLKIEGCYLLSNGVSIVTIVGNPSGNQIIIKNNNIVSSNTGAAGITVNDRTKGMLDIHDNKFEKCDICIKMTNSHYCSIRNNFGRGITGAFLWMSDCGKGTIIDGNIVLENISFIYSTNLDEQISFGDNKTGNVLTSYRGSATIQADTTYVDIWDSITTINSGVTSTIILFPYTNILKGIKIEYNSELGLYRVFLTEGTVTENIRIDYEIKMVADSRIK